MKSPLVTDRLRVASTAAISNALSSLITREQTSATRSQIYRCHIKLSHPPPNKSAPRLLHVSLPYRKKIFSPLCSLRTRLKRCPLKRQVNRTLIVALKCLRVKYSPRCDFKTVSSLAFLGGIANFILVCLRLARDRLVSPTSYRLRIFSVYRQKFVAAEPRATRVSRVSRQAASPIQSVRVFSARQRRRSQSDHVADLQAAVAASSETSVCHTHTHTHTHTNTPDRWPPHGVCQAAVCRAE